MKRHWRKCTTCNLRHKNRRRDWFCSARCARRPLMNFTQWLKPVGFNELTLDRLVTTVREALSLINKKRPCVARNDKDDALLVNESCEVTHV